MAMRGNKSIKPKVNVGFGVEEITGSLSFDHIVWL